MPIVHGASLAKKGITRALQLLAHDDLAGRINGMHLKNRLREIEADDGDGCVQLRLHVAPSDQGDLIGHPLHGALAARNGRLYVPIMLAGLLGLRQGEVLGLHWADVDFSAARLSVRFSVTVPKSGPELKGVKTDRARTVAIPSHLEQIPIIWNRSRLR